MGEEEKGFVFKDKRAFDDQGDPKDESTNADEEKGPEAKKAGPGKDEESRGPLPEVNFNSLIFSLSSSALLNLGEIADPGTGQKSKDITLAKHTIDTIALLKDKTKGNLDDEEGKFLETVLADLRWRYVKATK